MHTDSHAHTERYLCVVVTSVIMFSSDARVPMSLIPGARSSRLKDRLREERELSVKKAFLEDILNENDLLSSLLRKESTIHAVIWNPHMLPSLSKGSQLPDGTAAISSSERENSHQYSGNDCSINLFKEMTMFMEALNDSYVDKDDLLFDFQVDSGTLPCVACGILGFPFMSVIEPSETASAALLPTKHYTQQTCGKLYSSISICLGSPFMPVTRTLAKKLAIYMFLLISSYAIADFRITSHNFGMYEIRLVAMGFSSYAD